MQGLFVAFAVWSNQIIKWCDKAEDNLDKWLSKREMELLGAKEITAEELTDLIEHRMNLRLTSIKIHTDKWGRVWCLVKKEDC